MKKISFVCFVIMYLSLPRIAFAQETQAWWQLALTHLIEIAITVITPSLIIIARTYAKVLAERNGIELAERQYTLLDDLVNKGVSYAHEQGRKALKADKPLSSTEKHAAAVEFVNSGLKHLGLVDASKDLLAQLVEAKLNLRRDDPVAPGKIARTNAGREIPQ